MLFKGYNVICFLFGHKVKYNDSGFDVCIRCNAHEFYDMNKYKLAGYLLRPYWKLILIYKNIKSYFRTKYGGYPF
jgi:hypothetical protein